MYRDGVLPRLTGGVVDIETQCKEMASDVLSPIVNPLPTIYRKQKQKSLYEVLTPSIKSSYINSYGLMGAHDAYMRHWLVKG